MCLPAAFQPGFSIWPFGHNRNSEIFRVPREAVMPWRLRGPPIRYDNEHAATFIYFFGFLRVMLQQLIHKLLTITLSKSKEGTLPASYSAHFTEILGDANVNIIRIKQLFNHLSPGARLPRQRGSWKNKGAGKIMRADF
jgi:hypothetical protein